MERKRKGTSNSTKILAKLIAVARAVRHEPQLRAKSLEVFCEPLEHGHLGVLWVLLQGVALLVLKPVLLLLQLRIRQVKHGLL